MQKKIKSRWPFTKKGINTPSSQPTPQSPADTKSFSLYHHITELPLSRWMDLVVDGNRFALIKSGEPPLDELYKAEAALRMQYADTIGDNEYRLYCNAINKITRQEITLAQVQSLVAALREAYVPAFEQPLNRLLLTSFKLDVTNPDEYDKTLQRALNRSKGIKLTIDLKRLSIAKLEEKYTGGTGQKASREYYMGILIDLSDAAHYPLSENITVWEFCERIRKHNKKADFLTRNKAKK